MPSFKQWTNIIAHGTCVVRDRTLRKSVYTMKLIPSYFLLCVLITVLILWIIEILHNVNRINYKLLFTGQFFIVNEFLALSIYRCSLIIRGLFWALVLEKQVWPVSESHIWPSVTETVCSSGKICIWPQGKKCVTGKKCGFLYLCIYNFILQSEIGLVFAFRTKENNEAWGFKIDIIFALCEMLTEVILIYQEWFVFTSNTCCPVSICYSQQTRVLKRSCFQLSYWTFAV